MFNTEIPDNFSGTVLIASPYLRDPNFRGSVVFLALENDDGILGLILNRNSGKKLQDFWQVIFGFDCPIEADIFVGGPVPGPLTVLHEVPEYADFHTGCDYYLTVEKRVIGELVRSAIGPLKFFLGQAGWTREQLIGEINSGAWHLLPPGETDLFREDSECWVRALQKSASRTFSQVLGIQKYPDNPEDN